MRVKLILAFTAVALIPMGLLFFLDQYNLRQALTRNANQSLLAAASQTAAELDRFFTYNLNAIDTEARLPVFSRYLAMPAEGRTGSSEEADVISTLRTLAAKDYMVSSYALLDQQGHILIDTFTPDIGLDRSNRDYFQIPLSTGQPYASPVEFWQEGDEGALYFSGPVHNNSHEVAGVLRVRYSAQALQQIVFQNNNMGGEQSFAILLDENCIQLAHAADPGNLFKALLKLDPGQIAALQAARRLPDRPAEALSIYLPDFEQAVRAADVQPFFSARLLPNDNQIHSGAVVTLETQPWHVVFAQPQVVFLAPARAQSINVLMLALTLAVVAAAMAVGTAQMLASPIVRLTNVARRIMAGDLSAQAKIRPGDELGTLAATFDAMTSQLRHTMEGLKQNIAELSALHAVAAAGTEAVSEDALIERVTQIVGECFYPDHFGVLLLDEQACVLRAHPSYRGIDETSRRRSIALGQGVSGQVAVSGNPWRISDVSQEPAYIAANPDMRSEMCVPLKVGEQIIGIINAESKTHLFSEADEHIMTTLAGQLATAISKVRLLDASQRQTQMLTCLYESSLTVTSMLETGALLRSLYTLVQQILTPETFVVALYDTQAKEIQVALAIEEGQPIREWVDMRIPLAQGGLTGWVIRTWQVLLVGDMQTESLPVIPTHGIRPARAWLGVPMIAHERLLGVISVQSFKPYAFDATHRRFLESMAGQVAIALENARLFEETCSRADELATALEQLQELDGLKSELIQNVSHELRTPLAIIRGYAELLEAGEIGELQADQHKYVAIIARRARMLGDMVQDITLILEAEATPPAAEPVQLDDVARLAAEEIAPAVRQIGLTLQVDIAHPLPPVKSTPSYVRRILDNLLSNALKFTTAGVITLRAWQRNDSVVLEVSDTGIGIPPDKFERIFERFYQVDGSTKRRFGGAGLGLALVKEIVQLYGGQVTVASKLGEGSTFIVTMPVFESDALADQAGDKASG